MSKFIYLTILILIAAIGIEYYINSKAEILTKKAAEWGKQNTLKLDKSAKREKFKITFDEAEWKSLQSKLDSTRYFNKLDNVPDFSYGFNPEYAKELVTYWRKSFDWKKQIDRLNKYQQYRITINNTVIHYIYHETNRNSKSQKPSINLMLVDGWPGCSFSFHKMIEKIETEYKDVSFKIIVPSIPGYGYSTPLNRVVDLVDTAILFDAIMRYENAEEYFVHGEDWGSGLATTLGLLFPGRVRGIHITLPFFASELSSIFNFGSYLLGQVIPSTYFSQKEIELNVPQRYSLSNRLWTVWFAFGYFHLQATKPDTVAHGLTDSPVGLLAYVLEKYSSWTLNYEKEILGKRDGGLGKFEKDDLLSIITIYWMTNSIGSSVRYYKANVGDVFTESSFKNQLFSTKLPTQVRIGIQQMDNELMMTPARVVQTLYPNLVQFEIVENGGHFAGFEKPLESAKNFGRFVLNSL